MFEILNFFDMVGIWISFQIKCLGFLFGYFLPTFFQFNKYVVGDWPFNLKEGDTCFIHCAMGYFGMDW